MNKTKKEHKEQTKQNYEANRETRIEHMKTL